MAIYHYPVKPPKHLLTKTANLSHSKLTIILTMWQPAAPSAPAAASPPPLRARACPSWARACHCQTGSSSAPTRSGRPWPGTTRGVVFSRPCQVAIQASPWPPRRAGQRSCHPRQRLRLRRPILSRALPLWIVKREQVSVELRGHFNHTGLPHLISYSVSSLAC